MFGWPAIIFSSLFIVVLAVCGIVEYSHGNKNVSGILVLIAFSILVILYNWKEVKANRSRDDRDKT
jgi:hypothetical protein